MSTSQEFPAFVNHHFGVILKDGEGRKMLQEHFDFLSKTFGKGEHFKIVLKENKGEPSIIE